MQNWINLTINIRSNANIEVDLLLLWRLWINWRVEIDQYKESGRTENILGDIRSEKSNFWSYPDMEVI